MNVNIWLLISNLILLHNCKGQDNVLNSSGGFVFEPRIVGGRDAKKAERPFQVSLQQNSHFCGGTIINKQYIVTAAHCTQGKSASSIKVVVGTISLKKPYQTYQASKIINHETYTPKLSYLNDIALIKVSRSIEFNNLVKAVRLPSPNIKLYVGEEAVVSGWGYKSALSPQVSDILQEVEIKITSIDNCKSIMGRINKQIYPTQVCAYDEDRRKGHCRGDSGGPLTVNGVLVGIVSWSIKDPECASPKYPGVYTRVSKYINWINTHI